jgi:exopolysaccharide biosynthesis polyprenyl glycosylphosphotransferase
MLKDNERLFNNALATLDIFLTLIAFYLAYTIRVYIVAKYAIFSDQYILLGAFIIPIWFILLKIVNVQSSQRIKPYSIVFIEYSLVVFIGVIILFLFIFIFKLDFISRIAILIFGIADLFLLFVSKVLILSYAKKILIKGENVKRIILIADESSSSFIEKIISEKYWGFVIFGIITESEELIEKYANKYKIISNKENIEKLLVEHIVDEVIYCKDEIDSQQIKHLIYSCAEIGVTLKLQSELFNIIASKSRLNYFEELPMMSFNVTSADYFALSIKHVFEYLLSILAVLVFLPFFLIISMLIKIESKGPALYKQRRVGLHGRHFTMYKFRTMILHSDEQKRELESKNEVDGPVFKIKNDPRITKIGGFLRKTSLDEFPQFFNVLKGEMSVVGPRPPIPEEVALYERAQLRRLSVKPGITCIWQVSGRNKIGFEEWMKLDLQYIDNWSLKLDFILILKTINAIYRRTGY